MRALEERLRDDLPEYSLVTSLGSAEARDLRVIISDGHLIFLCLGQGDEKPRLFGGVSIDDLASDRAALDGPIRIVDTTSDEDGFGGPEGSRFSRSEISLTAIARALPLC